MKSDALTIAAIVFILGIVATSFGLTDWRGENAEVPTELQRGFTLDAEQ